MWQTETTIINVKFLHVLADSASSAEADRPWHWRVDDLLESSEQLRRSGLAGTASPSTVRDVVGRSSTVSFRGRRAKRGRPALGVWTALVMLTDVAADGLRVASSLATDGGTTRCVDANSVGPLDSLPAVEQSLMLDRLRRSICSDVHRQTLRPSNDVNRSSGRLGDRADWAEDKGSQYSGAPKSVNKIFYV